MTPDQLTVAAVMATPVVEDSDAREFTASPAVAPIAEEAAVAVAAAGLPIDRPIDAGTTLRHLTAEAVPSEPARPARRRTRKAATSDLPANDLPAEETLAVATAPAQTAPPEPVSVAMPASPPAAERSHGTEPETGDDTAAAPAPTRARRTATSRRRTPATAPADSATAPSAEPADAPASPNGEALVSALVEPSAVIEPAIPVYLAPPAEAPRATEQSPAPLSVADKVRAARARRQKAAAALTEGAEGA